VALADDNPWVELPTSAPLVLPVDAPYLRAFHRHEPDQRHFRLDLPPDPWLGCWDAPVVLLLQNPSFNDADTAVFARQDVVEANRRNMIDDAGGRPHYWLDDCFVGTYSGTWWRKTLSRLIQDIGTAATARAVLVVEMYGYRTREFRALPVTIPSQRFALEVVDQAIGRDATVVLPRAAPLWEVAYPTLLDYPRTLHGRSRNAIVSPGNLEPGGYDQVLGAIAEWEVPLAGERGQVGTRGSRDSAE
jgi:hypothetical protein